MNNNRNNYTFLAKYRNKIQFFPPLYYPLSFFALVIYGRVWYRNFMKLKNYVSHIFVILFSMAVFFSCASGPANIPDNLTAAELIQRGQEASDRNKNSLALQYYETLLYRFPYDADSVCAGEYEIAFIHYKQKKYDIAKTEFTNLLERYNTPDAALLPPQFKVLSQKLVERITEIEKEKMKE